MKFYAYRWQEAYNQNITRGTIQADDPCDAFRTLSGGWQFNPDRLKEDEGWIILLVDTVGVLELFPYQTSVSRAQTYTQPLPTSSQDRFEAKEEESRLRTQLNKLSNLDLEEKLSLPDALDIAIKAFYENNAYEKHSDSVTFLESVRDNLRASHI